MCVDLIFRKKLLFIFSIDIGIRYLSVRELSRLSSYCTLNRYLRTVPNYSPYGTYFTYEYITFFQTVRFSVQYSTVTSRNTYINF